MTMRVERLSANGHSEQGLSPIGLSFPDKVTSGDPQEFAHLFFEKATPAAKIGIWASEPGTVRFDSYPFDELCVIVEGRLILRSDGEDEVFAEGDVFLVREGWRGDWIMEERLKKFYVELPS
jgi:uncharacterized protein